jgi:hypothetical protein
VIVSPWVGVADAVAVGGMAVWVCVGVALGVTVAVDAPVLVGVSVRVDVAVAAGVSVGKKDVCVGVADDASVAV